MESNKKLQVKLEKVFSDKSFRINTKDKFKIMKQSTMYVDAIIFNIVSIFCLIAILNNTTQITDKTLEAGKGYIESKCNIKYQKNSQMTGGFILSSGTFLGKYEPMYNTGNNQLDTQTLDLFENARNQIGGGMFSKALKALKKQIMSHILMILKYHNVKASKIMKEEIQSIIMVHVEYLFQYMKEQKEITLKNLTKGIKKNKCFQVLK